MKNALLRGAQPHGFTVRSQRGLGNFSPTSSAVAIMEHKMSGFIEERFELHMLSDSTPPNQFQTDSSYLLGHIPDEIADDYSILFSKKT